MKTIFMLPLLLLTILGCSKDSKKEPTPLYVGKWQLVEVFNTELEYGVESKWKPIENGYILSLNENKTFTTTEYERCSDGSYSVADNVITYVFKCGTGNYAPHDTFRIDSNTENELIIANVNCVEACLQKLKKIE